MLQSDQYQPLLKELLGKLGFRESNTMNSANGTKATGKQNGDKNKVKITPSQALVIAAILGGTLEITSVLVDKDQTVEILLTGSLKRKSDLEKMVDEIGSQPFDKVFKAFIDRLT